MVSKNPLSLLQQARQAFRSPLPPILLDLGRTVPCQKAVKEARDSSIDALFPHTASLPIIEYQKGESSSQKPLKVGIVFSGGPAPGGHTVISGLLDAIRTIHPASNLIGFRDGPDGIVKNKSMELTEELVARYHNQGGFDLLGTGRTKIETEQQYEAVEKTLLAHQLDGLVIVGGDDSNTNAAYLAEYCLARGMSTRIIGVPKTIDGDLKNAFIEVSFGFDTAAKIYSEVIGNLATDALSQKKYYFFVKMMGRSASHLTLECALRTHVNLALIGEEIASRKDTLSAIVAQIADLICAREQQNKSFGVILVPEGLLEFISECKGMIDELNRLMSGQTHVGNDDKGTRDKLKAELTPEAFACFTLFPEDIQTQLLLDRDPHGNVQLSKVETERLLISLVAQELKKRKQQGLYSGQFNAQPLFCGYEGRCGLPSNFDCNYCYSLGHLAALLIRDGATGYLCSIRKLAKPVASWELAGIPIVNMLHFEIRKNKKQAVLKKALVDLNGTAFNRFKQERTSWQLADLYCNPGPMQFEGASALVDAGPLTLKLP